MRWRLNKLDWPYAIGELVIVTAGVLIALAIDQWNSDRLDRVAEVRVVSRLLSDLRGDVESWALGLEIVADKESRLERVRATLTAADKSAVDDREFLADVIAASNYGWNQHTATRVTFDELLSSGRLGLIRSDEVRTMIATYYDLAQDSFIRIDERETDYPGFSYQLAPRINEFELDPALSRNEIARLAAAAYATDLTRYATAELNLARFIRLRFAVLEGICNELISRLEGYLEETR